MRILSAACLVVGVLAIQACQDPKTVAKPGPEDGTATFSEDVAFLRQYTDIEVLRDSASGAALAVAPAWQGRVMTSTGGDEKEPSYGWIHYKNVKAGIAPEGERTGLQKHVHIFGGEERLWLGPEGGQYALFFPPEVPYEFEHWKTPALLDTDPFNVVGKSETSIRFSREASLKNRAGTKFDLRIERAVEIHDKDTVAKLLEVPVPESLETVGYRSTNVLTNTGDKAWTKDGGLISIWMLGMFKHSPEVTVVIPLAPGDGEPVRSDFFGTPGDDRLRVTEKAVFFKGDGVFRAKIGIPPGRSTGVAGSWDPQNGILTIVRCDHPENAGELPWVRSQWEDHQDPYDGEQIHSYNDGPTEPGGDQLGPSYGLETSSPALPLEPGQSITHVSDTVHFDCCPKTLGPIAEGVLGITLEEVEKAFE
jgi:hypothetical protein